MKIAKNGKRVLRFVRSNPPHRPNDVAGFEMRDAQILIDNKIAVDFDSEEEIEVEAGPPTKRVAKEKEQPKGIVGASGSNVSGDGDAEIPKDWDSMHHLKQIKLAEKISGGPVASKADAEAVIKAEVDRRAAA